MRTTGLPPAFPPATDQRRRRSAKLRDEEEGQFAVRFPGGRDQPGAGGLFGCRFPRRLPPGYAVGPLLRLSLAGIGPERKDRVAGILLRPPGRPGSPG